MSGLLQLFIRNGGFVTLVVLEALCFYLIVQFNERQRAIYGHTAMLFNQALAARRAYVDRYVGAADSLESLNFQLFQLQTELDNARQVRVFERDTFELVHIDSLRGRVAIPQFKYIGAEVVNNSVSSRSNWLTINRGTKHGVKPNMGVLARDGLVGIVRYVGEDFSIVMSVLHRQSRISASLKRQGFFGSLIWEGGDPTVLTLTDIPKHVQVEIGDTVVTSGYSSMFPRGVMVGKVIKDSIPSGSNFYSISVKTSNDIARTDYVRVVENLYQAQLDSLQRKVQANEQ